MRWWVTVAALALATSGCGMDPDATLTLAVDPVVPVTTAAQVTISGTITRTPPKLIPTVVEASGGVATAAATIQADRFSVLVTLNPNTSNTITLKATDVSGATTTATVTVVQRPAPGTLTITPGAFDTLTSAEDLMLTGTVTRAPNTVPIIVTASGGIGAPADTVTDGQFAVAVSLHPDQQNTIVLTASDDYGSMPVGSTVRIRHDGTAPAVTVASPADTADGVATGASVQISFSEPVNLGTDGGILLTRGGLILPGITTISADSLTVSFAPGVPLSPNAIYRVAFAGITDPAGNAVPFGTSTCFVTTTTGATGSVTATDSLDDVYASTPPPGIAAPDLIAARFAREGEIFSGVFRFRGPRSFARDGVDRAEIFIDLDTDQDSTTGFVTLKDTLFRNSGPPLDTLTSGTKAEYVIGLSPLAEFGDNAYVGRYTSPLLFQVAQSFAPDVCGAFMGFAIPFSLIDDDGKLNAVVIGYAGSGNAIFVDPMPTKGSFALDFPPPGPVAAFRAHQNAAGMRTQPSTKAIPKLRKVQR